MSSEWNQKRWGAIATLEYGKGLRNYDNPNGVYPVYGTNGKIGSCDSYLCPTPGIVIGRKGAYRGVHYSPQPFYVIDTAFYLKPKIQLDIKWAYYQLLTLDINGLDSGSAIPSTSREEFYSLPVSFPPLSEQKAIAHILGTLDDKIELNRKTNETLEAIAHALFKSWFVDFDPVHAKAAGRPTGLPKEISDLFPDSFEDSELGEIPKGWKVVQLSEVFSIQGGSQPPAKTFRDEPSDGYVRLLQIQDFDNDRHVTYVPFTQNLRIVTEDDVLIGRYGSGSGKFMKDSLGRPLRGLEGAINVAIVRVIPKMEHVSEYIATTVSSGLFYKWIVGGSARAVQAGFRQEDLDLIRVPLPSIDLLKRFQDIGSNVWKRTKLFRRSNANLEKLRDTLLPKLISGDLRVPDAEALVAEAGL